MKYHESQEMYLETILLLKSKMSSVRSIDIATELNYSRASVSRAVNLLQQAGYITIGKGGDISFTDAGRERAREIYDRHHVITEVLTRIGATPEIAEDNACRIEHVVSEDLLKVMREYLDNK